MFRSDSRYVRLDVIIIGFRYLSVIIMFESCEEKRENKEGCNQRELTKTYGLREVLHNYSCVRCCDCLVVSAFAREVVRQKP